MGLRLLFRERRTRRIYLHAFDFHVIREVKNKTGVETNACLILPKDVMLSKQ